MTAFGDTMEHIYNPWHTFADEKPTQSGEYVCAVRTPNGSQALVIRYDADQNSWMCPCLHGVTPFPSHAIGLWMPVHPHDLSHIFAEPISITYAQEEAAHAQP